MSADKGKSDAEVRVVFLKLHFLEVLLQALVDFMGNLFKRNGTAFSGRKRKVLKTKRNRVPKGSISMMART